MLELPHTKRGKQERLSAGKRSNRRRLPLAIRMRRRTLATAAAAFLRFRLPDTMGG